SKQMIYQHKALQVNYTTYDMHPNQDYLIPGINANIMLIGHEDENDKDQNVYWYGQIIGIFHADVRYTGSAQSHFKAEFHRMEFLWVRWLARDGFYHSGWKACR